MTAIRKVRFCYYMSGRSNGILAARRSIGNSNKVWAGTQIIKPTSSPHTHWLGLSVEIIAGPLKMQLLTLPSRLLPWLFLIALSEGGRAGIPAGSLREAPGTLRKGAAHGGWWVVVVLKAALALKEMSWGLGDQQFFLPFRKNPESLLITLRILIF